MPEQTKLFIIGYNKTATTSLSEFFAANGYSSVHWRTRTRINLAQRMTSNVMNRRPILAGIAEFDVYSDMTYSDSNVLLEGNFFYRQLHHEYPNAFFLLNLRDTDSWVRSRMSHGLPDNSFAARAKKAMGVSDEALIAFWKKAHQDFHSEVADYFRQASPDRFMTFSIDTQSPKELATWLNGHFELNIGRWVKANVTKQPAG